MVRALASYTKSIDFRGAFVARLANEIFARLNASERFRENNRSLLKAHAGRRVRRSSEALQILADELVTYVRAKPGSRIGEISHGLGYPKSSIIPTVRKLVNGDKLTTRGRRGGVRYFSTSKAPKVISCRRG
jgi:hypothetical protein